MKLRWVEKRDLPSAVRRMVKGARVVVDVGAGIEPQTLVWPKLHIVVEVHDEYVNYLRERLAGSPRYLVMHSPWEEALSRLASKSVDTVFALDFIEHLTKEEGLRFVAQAERVARKQVVLFTPLGYFPQEYESTAEVDRWGMHGGHWQTHRSGWTPEDFSKDWEVVACREYHTVDRHGALDEPAGCLWAIRTFPEPQSAAGAFERRLRLRSLAKRYVPEWCRPALGTLWRWWRHPHTEQESLYAWRHE